MSAEEWLSLHWWGLVVSVWPVAVGVVLIIFGEAAWRFAVFGEIRKSRKDRSRMWKQQERMWVAFVSHTHDDNGAGDVKFAGRDLRGQFEAPESTDSRDLRAVNPAGA